MAVEGIPLEVVLVVHEVPHDAVPVQPEQTAVEAPPAQGHLDMADKGHLVLPLFGHTLVEGQDHRHLITRSGQRLRQTAGHVGQAAGLAKRNSL